MISSLKRRLWAASPRKEVARDPAARFARDLAVQPPTKGVASVKAASDVYEAELASAGNSQGGRQPTTPERDA